jgi:hypothetical protein
MNAKQAHECFCDYYNMHALVFGGQIKAKITSSAILIFREFFGSSPNTEIEKSLLALGLPQPLPV